MSRTREKAGDNLVHRLAAGTEIWRPSTAKINSTPFSTEAARSAQHPGGQR